MKTLETMEVELTPLLGKVTFFGESPLRWRTEHSPPPTKGAVTVLVWSAGHPSSVSWSDHVEVLPFMKDRLRCFAAQHGF